MFGIDFSELMVCALVALVVIGPERMPEAVRTAGLWIGRLKRSLQETREQVEQQLGMEEVRRQLHTEEMMRTLDSMQEEIETALNYERMGSKANQAQAVEALPHIDAAGTPENSAAQIAYSHHLQTDNVAEATPTEIAPNTHHSDSTQPALKNI